MNIISPIQSTGYIEGYYGKLLTWKDRQRILKKLKKNGMKYYFYAPKEDVNHRYLWRDNYKKYWIKNFKHFLHMSQKNNIKVIFGISPGLDFNFNDFDGNISNHEDLNLLINKFILMKKIGVEDFAVLFDDIQSNFNERYKCAPTEGKCHALVANEIIKKLKKPLYLVPRVYSDELQKNATQYLVDLGKEIDNDISLFFCGKSIVSKNLNLSDKIFLKKYSFNKIIFWDNFYCNDYCPRRVFLGPWIGRNNLEKILVNGTGMIEIDLLILDIVASCNTKKNKVLAWKELMIKENVPYEFIELIKYFEKPTFGKSTNLKLFKSSNIDLYNLEKLLWNWKSPLSLELYPYFMCLKHDLLLQGKKLSINRIIKTQSVPLANLLKKNLRS